MFWDDLRKLLTSTQLYRLNGIIAGRLVPIFYALGLAAIALWAIDHLFASFAFNFGQGLWGILEIVVYGPLWVLGLRIICELILVFLKAHDGAAAAVDLGRRGQTNLLEEVGDAIHDLADDDDDVLPPAPTSSPPPGGPGGSPTVGDTDPLLKGTTRRPKRTLES